jgi:hypothetical protein
MGHSISSQYNTIRRDDKRRQQTILYCSIMELSPRFIDLFDLVDMWEGLALNLGVERSLVGNRLPCTSKFIP